MRRSSWCASSTEATSRLPPLRAVALLATAQLVIGAAAVFARFALAGAGPIAVAAGRLTIAGGVLLVALLVRRRSLARDPATERRLALAGLALGAHFACWIASLEFTSVAVSTLLVTTTPVFTELVTIVRTRRVRALAIASVVCTVAGAALVALAPHETGAAGRAPLLGAALALAGAITIGIYLLLVKASDARYRTLDVVGRTYPIAAVALLIAAALARQGPPAPGDGAAWGGIVAMALLSQLYGHTALNAAVRTFSATFVSMTTLTEPLAAAALAAVVFHERLDATTLAGAIVVFFGIGLALRDETLERAEAASGARAPGR